MGQFRKWCLLKASGCKVEEESYPEWKRSSTKVGRVRVQSRAMFARLLCGLVLLGLVFGRAWAGVDPEWTRPLAPFHIAGNLYYVGSRDLAAYLVTTPAGNILINSNLESSVEQIRRSVEQLGFRWQDTRVLLISHAHFDHAAGSAAIVRQTGAKYMVMDGDVAVVESGGAKDFAFAHGTRYPPAKVDRVLHDGDEVRLGGAVLVAHKTPGHTRGCTTWTMRVREDGREENVVIVGSWNVLSEYQLVGRPGRPASYPGIAKDFERTFAVIRELPCDVFLAAHGSMFDLLAKRERMTAEGGAVWIDREGYRRAVAAAEERFRQALAKQERAG